MRPVLALAALLCALVLPASAQAGVNVFIGSSTIPVPGGFTCTSTLNSGANVATALTNAAAGDTVCLNAGTYSYNASVSKAAMTRVTAANGVTASQITFTTFETNQSNNLTFDKLTISADGHIGNNPSATGSTHLYVTNGRVVSPGSLCVQNGNSNADVVIDGMDFGGTDQSQCGEGRMDIQSSCTSCGITVRNSTFGPNGDGDGMQIHWGADGITVGPGNVFHGIKEGQCPTTHCDSIQLFSTSNVTITGNQFYDVSTAIANFDCATGEKATQITVTNNVIWQEPASETSAVSVAGGTGDVFTHNTFGPNTDLAIQPWNDGCANTGLTVRDNVLATCATNATSSTFATNLVASGACAGTGGITGAPTFVGGTTPTTWAGFQLTSGSLGHLAASDGLDMGATSFGG